MEFLKYAGNREKLNRIMQNDDRYKSMDHKAANVLSSCADIEIKIDEGTEDVNMCKAWEDQKLVGVKEGEIKGRREGKIEGKKEGRIEGEDRLSTLILKLIADGLSDMVQKVAVDKDCRAEMYKKYNL